MKIERIQYITQDSDRMSHVEQAELMFQNGIPWVQLRMKNSTKTEIIEAAEAIQDISKHYNGSLIINDSVEIAKQVNAPIVHLGLNDMPIDEARLILGDNVIIGGTANTVEQVMLQAKRGANYVGLGPFQFTTTKKNLSPVIGLKGYQQILSDLEKANCKVPIFAVGGITLENIDPIHNIGIHGVAISGALLKKYLK